MYTVQPNDETDLKPVHPKYNILNERISVIKLFFLKPYPNVSWQSNAIKYDQILFGNRTKWEIKKENLFGHQTMQDHFFLDRAFVCKEITYKDVNGNMHAPNQRNYFKINC